MRLRILVALLVAAALPLYAQWQPSNAVSGPIYYNGGNVGIGTSSPGSLLTIGAFIGYGATNGLLVGSNLYGTTYDRALQIAPVQVASPGVNSIVMYVLPTINSGVTVPAQYGLYVDQKQGAGTATNYFPAVFMGGNVGIGNNAPAYSLDVNGTLHVASSATIDGNIAAKYQDVAEWVPSARSLAPATVVVLDRDKENVVTESTHAYDTAVAGVVSQKPGLVLGDAGKSKVMVATTGRVEVNVTASTHPIHVGDLLVTSDVPGVAMYSEPVNVAGVKMHRPGTVIGKALQPLQQGRGKILVLLTLQ